MNAARDGSAKAVELEELLLAAAAGGREVSYLEKSETTIRAFRGAIAEYGVARSAGAVVRALVGDRLGAAYTERLAAGSLAAAGDEAEANARSLDGDSGNALYDIKGRNRFDLRSGARDETTEPGKEFALELERRCYALDPRVKNVVDAGYAETEYARAVAGAGKGYREERRRVHLGYAYVVAGEADETVNGFHYISAPSFEGLDLDVIARKAVGKAIEKLGAAEPASGQRRVVLSADAAGPILEAFATAFSGELIQKGKSVLSGKRGQKIGGDLFTLIDDPLGPGIRGRLPGQAGGEPFDDEGVPSPKLHIFREGRFESPLHTLYSARRGGEEPNGRAFRRNVDNPLFAEPINAYVHPGRASPEDLIDEAGSGIYVTEIEGLASLNTTSGDFSAGAKGFEIVGGKRGAALRNFTIAGNFLEFIASIRGVADDLRLDAWFDTLRSPSLLIESLAISGRK